MKSLPIAALTIGFIAASARAGLPVQATFTGAKSERTWTLAELNAELPADWSPHEFLVIEFKAAAAQRFDLGLETPKGRYAKRIGPFAGG